MKIAEVLLSRMDYPGHNAKVLFAPGCNFRCPSCYNRQVVENKDCYDSEKELEDIKKACGWIDALVISGGEASLQPGLKDLLKSAKEIDLNYKREKLRIKLDTNGSNPGVLEELLKEKLIDYLALDIKGPEELYCELTSRNVSLEKIEESMRLSGRFSGHEYRTTIVPVYDNGFRWFNDEEVKDMVEWVREYGNGNRKWYLQPFVSRSREEMIDEMFSSELLKEEFHRTPEHVLEHMKEIINDYFDCEIR